MIVHIPPILPILIVLSHNTYLCNTNHKPITRRLHEGYITSGPLYESRLQFLSQLTNQNGTRVNDNFEFDARIQSHLGLSCVNFNRKTAISTRIAPDGHLSLCGLTVNTPGSSHTE